MKVKKSQVAMFAAALLGVVAIFMLLLSGVTVKSPEFFGESTSESVGTGFELMFGTANEAMKFNFMMFLPLLLVVVGLAGVALNLAMKSNLGKFIAMAAFVVAGIFFFCYGAFYPMCAEGLDIVVDGIKEVGGSVNPGIGAILAGILSIVAAVASALSMFVLKD